MLFSINQSHLYAICFCYFLFQKIPNTKIGAKYPYFGAAGINFNVDTYTHEGKYVLCGRVGAAGTIHNVDGKFNASSNVLIISPNDESGISTDYLAYYMKAVLNLSQYATGSLQPLITSSLVKEQLIRHCPDFEVAIKEDVQDLNVMKSRITSWEEQAKNLIFDLVWCVWLLII